MATQYISKTQHYQRVQKPLLERQRRARINKCLDALKQMMAEFQSDDAILRMDKAEMLETTIAFMRKRQRCATSASSVASIASVDVDSYKHGYMNAVNEVSRVLASIPGMSVDLGKSVMSHLGRVYNRLQQEQQQQKQQQIQPLTIDCCTTSSMASLSPASSGYHSDYDSPAVSPVAVNLSSNAEKNIALWRPW